MSKKIYQVNWNVFGTIEVNANNEEEAKELVNNMNNKELQDRILEEATQSFEIGTIEEAKPYKFITEIVTEMNNAINKYGVDKVELLLLEEEGIFYIHYHDKHDSHPIGDTYSISDYDIVDIEQLEKLCNENNFDFDRM
ncbi:hypothetical protein [Clostridium botulinum]|uniref:hypothetical protein n=1 Tax=Clostridium botulinum TaxID=1491 RepID=UPI00016DBB60|nr:hypothetical protein [Clostridium botulinum]ACA57425.1 hypothetical protein CLK_A0054 [Clostridium botulinum A3 str. Loch Maree]BDB03616.1 hypothetical protein CBOS2020_36900 [Clostridium botulinum]